MFGYLISASAQKKEFHLENIRRSGMQELEMLMPIGRVGYVSAPPIRRRYSGAGHFGAGHFGAGTIRRQNFFF